MDKNTSIHLIIKGEFTTVYKDAEARGVELKAASCWRGFGGNFTTTATTDKKYLEQVVAWFCETTGPAPFPIGTLLHYSIKE